MVAGVLAPLRRMDRIGGLSTPVRTGRQAIYRQHENDAGKAGKIEYEAKLNLFFMGENRHGYS